MALANNRPHLFVVFGRPGSGKSTIADAAAVLLKEEDRCILRLDLDVCVPPWMKDNFSKGIYPTHSQRKTFAIDACNYLATAIANAVGDTDAIIVSFSFVNHDLRSIFRQHFPKCVWLLVDTSNEVAINRINQRPDHFYKGNPSSGQQTMEDDRNIDWVFAPINFQHTIVDGMLPISCNARIVADIVHRKLH